MAEGVEDEGQLLRLREMGCELGQGFYFARPAPLDELTPRSDRVAKGRARPVAASPERRTRPTDVHAYAFLLG